MLRNYLKIAWRNLTRNKSYTAINLAGLAIGFACCILIALFVYNELSYDDFHEKADRIVHVGVESRFGGEQQRGLATEYPLADALKTDLPIVEETMRALWPGSGEVSLDGQDFAEVEGVFHVEAPFFQIFDFPLLRGNLEAVLAEPNTAVVSQAFAERYFPEEDPIGQTLHVVSYGEREYEITGVAESRPNSYLDFNVLLSFASTDYGESHGDSWGGRMFNTYALLQEGSTPEDFDRAALHITDQYLPEDSEVRYFAAPISGLYLSELVDVDGFRGELRYIYLFGTVALIILLLACVNYINLMTARATSRAKEVGVRRTVGAGRGQVAGQFLLESVLLTLAAFILALAMARMALPGFNQLFDTEIALSSGITSFILLLAGAALLTGLLAGSYPALYLAGFQPTAVLRGAPASQRSGEGLRKGLVTFQFGLAIALVVCTGIVYQQLQFAQETDLGFYDDQVLYTNVPAGSSEAYREAVSEHASIQSTTITQGLPGSLFGQAGLEPERISPRANVEHDEDIAFRPIVADAHYVETLGLEIIAGRDLSEEHSADEREGHLINESFARALGWTPEEAVGQPFTASFADDGGEVTGVVKDFHTASVREAITPVVIHMYEGPIRSYERLAVRIAPAQISEARTHIETQWAQFSDEPVEISFLDEDFAAMYETERRLSRVFALFAGLSIFIACLGLFGLAAYAAEQRRQEIGIRKVLGATARSIVALLSKDFLKLVLIGFVLAAPVAYYAMSRWLEDFAYRIDIGPGVFVVAGLAALAIALLTVSYQALRAAWMNPTEAIRQE